jgi:calcineurin-like phosphoesterase family protein
MSDYWFTADTHFNHSSILEHCRRPFKTVDKMNKTIIKRWNKLIKPEDFVYHLGDFSFCEGKKFFNELNGRKYLIRGNHDSKQVECYGWVWVKDTAMIEIFGQYLWLSHYAHRVWNRQKYGVYHLFGHTHNKLPPYSGSLDVGVDGNNFYPWNLNEINIILKKF